MAFTINLEMDLEQALVTAFLAGVQYQPGNHADRSPVDLAREYAAKTMSQCWQAARTMPFHKIH